MTRLSINKENLDKPNGKVDKMIILSKQTKMNHCTFSLHKVIYYCQHISCSMRKQDFGLCEKKGADQLCSNCTADQRLYFHYMDSTISPITVKYKI